jgi:hypothetical protein
MTASIADDALEGTHALVNARDRNLISPEAAAASLVRRILGEDNGQTWRADA